MRQEIDFYKMVASGNDFVVVDNTRQIIKDVAAFAASVCDRHNGVGADGVLLYEPSQKGNFKMRIINADGSEAEACGNGFRCIALFAKEKAGLPPRMRFESLAGLVTAEVKGARVKVQLPDAHSLKLDNEIDITGNRLHYAFVNTGVPHVVIFVEGIEKIAVEELGRAIRNHSKFHPRGTNVNFVELQGKNLIHARTYERGVEDETKACGTGSVASSIVTSLSHGIKPPIQVKTAGGEILIVDFKVNGKKISQVTLEGNARFVYEGRMLWERSLKKK